MTTPQAEYQRRYRAAVPESNEHARIAQACRARASLALKARHPAEYDQLLTVEYGKAGIKRVGMGAPGRKKIRRNLGTVR